MEKDFKQAYWAGSSSRNLTFRVLCLFWLTILVYLLTQWVLKYFVILQVWGSNNLSNYSYHFITYNTLIAITLAIIHSFIIYIKLHIAEQKINLLFKKQRAKKGSHGSLVEENSERNEGSIKSLLQYFYHQQKTLPYIFLSFALCYSLAATLPTTPATASDWFHLAFYAEAIVWLVRGIEFLLYFSLGFVAYRLFIIFIVRALGNEIGRFEISLLGNKKPLNSTYENLITVLVMSVFCIILFIYVDTLITLHSDLVLGRLLSISALFARNSIAMDNFLLANIMKREISQQAIMFMGMNPYVSLGENASLAILRTRSIQNFGFYIVIFYISCIFTLYFGQSIYITRKVMRYLCNYLRGVLQGGTSLKKTIPLICFDFMGYMTGYLNLLFSHMYNIISNLLHSVQNLGKTSEKLISDVTSGTNEVYRITNNFSSLNLKADLQLQSLRIMHEASRELRKIIQSIDDEVRLQKEQLENAKDSFKAVQTFILDTEDSCKNAAQLYTQLGNSAGNGLQVVEDAHTIMGEVSKTSNNIRDIVSSIEKISGQTGLLAMSASIESAHAGEHGMGFSIVAQSVRSLSDDSGIQSKAIRSQIEELLQKVEIGLLLSRHVKLSFQSIAGSTKISAELFQQIGNSIGEQKEQSSTIAKEIDELLASTEDILDFTKEQMTILDNLSKTSSYLEKEIMLISKTSQNQSSMSNEVIALFESLNNQTLLNIERVQSMSEKIKRFALD